MLLDDRIKRLTPREEDKYNVSDRSSVIIIFQTRSILVFRDTLDFLASEILVPDAKKRAFFLLPHARTLLDIYARFLHLLINCPDEDKRALTCIAYQMLGARLLTGSTAYDEALKIYGVFLDRVKPDFPKDPATLKYGWIVKNGLAFADRDELLTPENMKRFSNYSLEVFGTEKTYFIYSSISEFLHGNPYYYRGEEHNERFWVTSTAMITTAFFVELIDRYILDVQPRDFREWLAEVKRTKGEYARFWNSKRTAMLAQQKERGEMFSE